MNTFEVKITPNNISDLPMRNILGMNNSPRIRKQSLTPVEKEYFDALNLKYLRHHDAPLENPAFKLVDVSRIFPLFHLDENDEKNYFFGQTDDYFSVFAESNIELDFRVGETIDGSGFGRLIQVPSDIEKWARICRNIIGHYKNGEMNGMHLNLKRVTVWEEPDHDKLLRGTVEQYTEMFCAVYKLLKKDFPDLKIGGPTIANDKIFLENFLRICKEKGVVPDYVSHNLYEREVGRDAMAVRRNRELMDKYGFYDTTDIITEWNLEPTDWAIMEDSHIEGFFTPQRAAFCVSSLIELEDIPYLEAVYYYSWATTIWGVAETNGVGFKLRPIYFGLLFFQMLAANCNVRLDAEYEKNEAVRVLAGKTQDNKVRLLISCYESDEIKLTAGGFDFKKCTLRAVNPQYNEEECVTPKELTPDNNKNISVTHTGKSGVYLFEFEI